MAEILESTSDQRRRPGIGRIKRHSLKTDMTPMVDLGFLLITFFVFTAQLNQPSVVKLKMPKEGDSTRINQSNALTVLLDDDEHVYYYLGDWNESLLKGEIFKTNLSVNDGFGKIIRERQKWLDVHNKKDGRGGLMLLIKAGTDASYRTLVDALDEAMINDVPRYAVIKIESRESAWMKQKR